jgi:UDP-N-acetylmuramate--alanine ligase
MSEKAEIDFSKRIPLDLDKSAKIHFIAVGGIGVSAIAKCFLELGFKVSGSDIKENKNINLLKEMGAEIFIGHDASNIEGADIIIASSAIRVDNPEVIEAQKRNIPIYHRSQGLDAILRGAGQAQKPVSIGLSGTHGKTTTTGMASLIFELSKKDPTMLIGGILPQLGTNAKVGKGGYAIAELDESDGTIVFYAPDITVVTNLEVDHLDHYKDGFKQVLATFKQFTDNFADTAKLILNADDSGCMELYKIVDKSKVVLYSIKDAQGADFYAKNANLNGLSSSFDVYKKDQLLGRVDISVPGEHNVSNSLAVIIASLEAGISFEDIKKSIKEFGGTKRRFEYVGEFQGAKIYDDYAHHPTEIMATLHSAKQLNKRVVALFQPHRYTRLKALWDDFKNSFGEADELVVIDVYSAGDEFDPQYNSENFAKEVEKAHYIKGSVDEVKDSVADFIKADDIVLTIGAGDITQLGYKLCQK